VRPAVQVPSLTQDLDGIILSILLRPKILFFQKLIYPA